MTLHKEDSCASSPEDLRRYYLDAMGIQVWHEQPREGHINVEEPSQEQVGLAKSPDVESTLSSELWPALQTRVSNCTLCELHTSRTQTVFGVGNKNADLLVIGEAPGRDEDLQGEPFVGRAGQLLTAMLAAIGLQRDEVYIANILKCRPPNNRDPLPAEVQSCRAYLHRQIELMQPGVILAVGRVAAQLLLDTDTGIGKLRGQQHSYEGIPLIVSYHPAYLLRKPSEKRKSWQDLLQLKRLLTCL